MICDFCYCILSCITAITFVSVSNKYFFWPFSARIPVPRGNSASRNVDYLARVGAIPKVPIDSYNPQTWSGGRTMLSTPNSQQPIMQIQLPDGYFSSFAPIGAATAGNSAMFMTGTGENSQMSIDSGSKRTRDTKSDKKTDKKKYGVCAASMV